MSKQISSAVDKSSAGTDSFSDTDEELFCPLCVEEIDVADKNFLPCPCGYRVCMWCWHHIRENLNGLCPACRTPYKEDPHAFAAVDRQEIVKKSKDKRLKDKVSTTSKSPAAPGKSSSSSSSTMDRKLLHNFRVVQRNLVYVIGLPAALVPTEDTLRKPEFFGQYGKIGKVVVHRNSAHSAAHNTVSAYVTFVHKEDAKAAIQALDGHWLDSSTLLRASFGTTKYCNNFVRGVSCSNPDCVYLHEIGDDEDRFTKEEIQAGHSKLAPTAGVNQMVVTGNGGPSGTGKKPVGEPTLPPPVFVQDIPVPTPTAPKPSATSSTAAASITATQPPANANRNTSWSANPSDRKASSHDLDSPSIGPVSDESVSLTSTESTLPRSAALSQSNSSSSINNNDASSDGKKQISAVSVSDTLNPAGTVSSVVDSQSNLSQPVNNGIASTISPTDGLSPADMLYPLQRLASGARSETLRHQVAASAFNGLGSSTVFPVPVSSLSISVWSFILTNSGNSLEVNPYEKLLVPISELMDLTIPPVDAIGNQPWPRPLSYYRRGIDPVVPNATQLSQIQQQQFLMKAQAGQYPGMPPQPSVNNNTNLGINNMSQAQAQAQALQRQQLQRQQQEMFLRNQQLRQPPGSTPPVDQAALNGMLSSNGQVVNGLYNNGMNPMMNPNQSQLGLNPSMQNMSSLQQMFPAGKQNYGAPGSSASSSQK